MTTFRDASFNLRANMGRPVPCCTAIDVLAADSCAPVTSICGCQHAPNLECPCVVPPPPPPPSFWDEVVGIPLDEWMAADTSEQVHALIAKRDEWRA